MAQEMDRSRSFSIWVNGEKLATFETADLAYAGNHEIHQTDGGPVGTTGKTTSTLKANTIVVSSGKTAKLKRALVSGKFVTIQVSVVDGDTDRLTMMVNGASYNSDVKNGKLMGAFDFIGAEPEST